MLSAESTADAVNGLISSTRSELLKLQQEYGTQKRYVSLDAPQMRNLQARINAANDQIALLQAKLTNSTEKGDAKAISNVMSKLDYLELNRQISEKLYGSAMSALERARLSSESKMLYINSFVLPVLPQEARIVTRRPIFGDILRAPRSGQFERYFLFDRIKRLFGHRDPADIKVSLRWLPVKQRTSV